MPNIKKQILDIIFWVALIIGIIMVLWRIFGDSPTDLAIITPFIVMLISKIWDINNDFRDFRHQVKSSFSNVRGDINRIENKIDSLINKKIKK